MSEPMAIVEIGYTKYVLPITKATQLLQLLAEAEVYETKWRKSDEGGQTKHIYPNEAKLRLELMSATEYRMAQMAGKPDND